MNTSNAATKAIFAKRSLSAVALVALVTSLSALSAEPQTYQVTGPVLEVSPEAITVEKGKEKWEVARTADTKITGDLKVGAKVTIQYRMTAASVEVKEGGASKPVKAKK